MWFLLPRQRPLVTRCPHIPPSPPASLFSIPPKDLMWKGSALDWAMDLQFRGSSTVGARKGSPLTLGLPPSLPHRSSVPRLKGTCVHMCGQPCGRCSPSFRLKGVVTGAMAALQEEGPGKEALKGGSVSLMQRILEGGVLVPWSMAQRGIHALLLGTSPGLLRLAAPWRRGAVREGPERGPFKDKT